MREDKYAKKRYKKEEKLIKKATIILEVEVALEDLDKDNISYPRNTSHFLNKLKNQIKESCKSGIEQKSVLEYKRKSDGKEKSFRIKPKVLVKSIKPSLGLPPPKRTKKKPTK